VGDLTRNRGGGHPWAVLPTGFVGGVGRCCRMHMLCPRKEAFDMSCVELCVCVGWDSDFGRGRPWNARMVKNSDVR
jgi:hypothetical protein